MDPENRTHRPPVVEDVDDCLALLGLGPGPEYDRCRAMLQAATRGGISACDVLHRWFASVLGDVSLAAARAAFLLAGGARAWSDELLASPSAAFREALGIHLPRATPDEIATAMPAQRLAAWSPADLWRSLTRARELDRTKIALHRER